MSNLWINIRVWRIHLQIGPDRPWVALHYNTYVSGWRVFDIFGYHRD